ncbi:MurR/RpiR family transcriptional regulator [Staphylococcus schleiferi]|uniref:MurR/RpiR family transcriptional regulator n=1 Tax=Staphylococcus schleiferi TaxID=1295 RepID=UPI0024811DEE|nr:MurR/RpiR family transcriptional regulator [Staphylococcus schleiferi]
MGVLSHMKSMQAEMSAAERKIFQFIYNNSEKIASMTANDIAKASGASSPTVVRFSKKMGYNSFTELKIELSAETKKAPSMNSYSDVDRDDSFHSLKNKLANNAHYTIDETTALFNEEEFIDACKFIEEKEYCYVLGIGASSLTAMDIVQKWGRLGKNVVSEPDYNTILPQLILHQKECVIWLVSNSGMTSELISLAETAKDLEIPIITLTQFGQNPLSKLADVSLKTSRPMESIYRSAATDSILAQFITVDLLFYVYISRNQENAEKIYTTRSIVEAYRKKYF